MISKLKVALGVSVLANAVLICQLNESNKEVERYIQESTQYYASNLMLENEVEQLEREIVQVEIIKLAAVTKATE